MSNHITQKQVEQFRSRTLDPPGLLAMDDHLSKCAECRGRLAEGDHSPASLVTFAHAGLAEHPTREELTGWVDGHLESQAKARVEMHLLDCDDCREDVADLRQFREETVPRRRPLTHWYLPAAGIAAALFIGALMFNSLRQGAGRPVGQPLAVALKDAGTTIGIDAHGGFAGPNSIAPGDRLLLASALQSGTLTLNIPAGLDAPGSVLRSADPEKPRPLRAIAPVAENVLSERPTFQWTAVPQADSYRIEIYDRGFNLVESSPELKVTNWTASQPLGRDAAYVWQVIATVNGSEVRAPQPPEPEARFRVVDAKQAAPIENLLEQTNPSHLLLAIKMSEAGMRHAALDQVADLAKENPGSAVVTRLQNGLER